LVIRPYLAENRYDSEIQTHRAGDFRGYSPTVHRRLDRSASGGNTGYIFQTRLPLDSYRGSYRRGNRYLPVDAGMDRSIDSRYYTLYNRYHRHVAMVEPAFPLDGVLQRCYSKNRMSL
jgi:hypothetical protein